MKKKILRSVLFLTGLVILITVFSVILKPEKDVYNSVGVDRKAEEIDNENDNSLDVVFLGDSESYSAFDPLMMYDNYGFTSYVCGTSLQKLCDTYAILENMYKSQQPKAVVIETNCMFRPASPYGETDDKTMNMFSKAIPLMRYHDRWKTLIPMEEKQKGDDEKHKGFKYRDGVKPYTGGEWMKATDICEPLTDCNMKYFEKIRALVEENGSKLILVSVPSPENWTYEKHNAMKKLADDKEIDFVDLNLYCDKLNINWNTDTRDQGNHLNYSGAVKVSEYIGKYLSEKEELPDHRGDEDFKGWDELVSRERQNGKEEI